jgi:CheY-like chemotaxis protein
MARPSLEGRSILVVEDQPLVALDITQQFEAAGAALTTTNTLHHALILVNTTGYRAPSWIMRSATETARYSAPASGSVASHS